MKLVIVGYYGFDNLGDELLLRVLLQALPSWSKQICVLSGNPGQTRTSHQVAARSRWNPWTLFFTLLAGRTVLFGGGGLIQDISSARSPLYYLGLLAMAKAMGKKVRLVGQGMGPLRFFHNLWLGKLILSWADEILLRDVVGLSFCQRLGIQPRQLAVGADLGWAYQGTFPARQVRNTWTICLRSDWLDGTLPEWLRRLQRFADKHHKTLRLVSLGHPADNQLLAKIREQAEFAAVDCRQANLENLAACFAGSQIVMSMRYHGILLGALSGALVTGWGRDEKILLLLQELEQPVFDPKRPEASFGGMQAQAEQLQQRLKTNVRNLTRRAHNDLDHIRAVLARDFQ